MWAYKRFTYGFVVGNVEANPEEGEKEALLIPNPGGVWSAAGCIGDPKTG